MPYPTPYSSYIDASTTDVATALQALPRDELMRILAARRVDPSIFTMYGAAQSSVYVASVLSMPVQVQEALYELSARELAVLQVLWRRGARFADRDIVPLFFGLLEASLLRPALARLHELALLLPADAERSGWFVPNAVRTVLLGRMTSSHSATELYGGLTKPALQAIATSLGIAGSARTKADFLEVVIKALTDPVKVKAIVGGLNDEYRQIFDEIRRQGAAVEPYRLAQRFPQTAAGNFYGGWDLFLRNSSMRQLENPLLQLQLRGLIVGFPPGYPSMLTIADEVLTALLPPFNPRAEDFHEPVLVPPPDELRPAGAAPPPVLDLVECLHFATETTVAATLRGLLPKPQRQRLARRLTSADPVYADFIFALALQLGLIESAGPETSGALRRGKRANAWIGSTEDKQQAALLAGWLLLERWRDDMDEAAVRSEAGYTILNTTRRLVAEVIGTAPAAGATIESIVSSLRFRMPMAFDPRIPRATAASDPANAADLVRGVGRSLAWLGFAEFLVTPARPSSAPEPAAIRLTSLGHAVLSPASYARPVEVPRTDRLIVQPTLDIVAPPNVTPAIYDALRTFTEPRTASGSRTVSLTAAALRRAFDNGISPENAVAFLEQHSDGPLPSTVQSLIADTRRQYGRVRVGEGSFFITVDDPLLLTELAADRRLADLALRTIAPTVALAKGASLQQVLDRLRQAGQMPVIDKPRDDQPKLHALPAGKGPPKTSAPTGQRTLTLLRGGDTPTTPRVPAQAAAAGSTNHEQVRDREAIIDLLIDAYDRQLPVEIEYRAKRQGVEVLTRRVIDVLAVSEENVTAFVQDQDRERTLQVKRIQWARFANEAVER